MIYLTCKHTHTHTGGDYIFNTSVILTPSTTFLNLPLEIVNDSYVEDLEVFTITFSGRTEVPGVDILTMPASVTISITDDDGKCYHIPQEHCVYIVAYNLQL